MEKLAQDITLNPYQNYIYSYPHKTAYRTFPQAVSLKALWETAAKQEITLYVHIPFCLDKCGYCNLFSSTSFDLAAISRYVDSLIKEIQAVSTFIHGRIGVSPFSKVIFGGGTPTIINDFEYRRILEAIADHLRIDFSQVFFSTEISPKTITRSKLELLKEYHVDRVSLGIQSFKEQELQQVFRRESVRDIEQALQLIFTEDIPIRNLDLIYGIPSQTLETWEESLGAALTYRPEEIYLYPIYIREKTSLYERSQRDSETMLSMYRFAKDFLVQNNYMQTSMRNFIRKNQKVDLFPAYSCQENAMVGIGCGARSYVGNVHYSRNYAVEQKNINRIIEAYIQMEDFTTGNYGYVLNEEERKRRYILKSILKVSGLDIKEYQQIFLTSPVSEFKELAFLLQYEFLMQTGEVIYPTEKGLMCSDGIGPLLISDEVAIKMNHFSEMLF